MQLAKVIPILTMCLAGAFVVADDVDCSKLSNPQARQECAKHKTAANADCSAVSDPEARKECAEHKQQNTANCAKLKTPEARQKCVNQKDN